MIRTGIETDIEEQSGVRENILGTDIRGRATMKGRLSIDLIPSQHNAAIDLVLTGTTYSNNRGCNGPVTIFSTAVTSVNARKRVLIEAEGIGLQPARAGCRTSSRIHRISAHSPLIERIAWKRAGRSKSQVEAIASQRAARRVAAQMDSEVVEVLAPAKELFAEKFRDPLGSSRRISPGVPASNERRSSVHSSNASVRGSVGSSPDEPPVAHGRSRRGGTRSRVARRESVSSVPGRSDMDRRTDRRAGRTL
jgi:hypothetical protein